MDLQDVQALCALDRLGHFGQAAADLGVAQPALSQRIARIEREVGTAVFARSSRGVTATATGALVLQRAKAVLAAVAEFDATARRCRARGAQGLRLAGPWGLVDPAAAQFLPPEPAGLALSAVGAALSAADAAAVAVVGPCPPGTRSVLRLADVPLRLLMAEGAASGCAHAAAAAWEQRPYVGVAGFAEDPVGRFWQPRRAAGALAAETADELMYYVAAGRAVAVVPAGALPPGPGVRELPFADRALAPVHVVVREGATEIEAQRVRAAVRQSHAQAERPLAASGG
jgi:DNA-binding transcriptional LysR family regulator